ncbi:MAG: sugar transferase, partial [Anaerolineales bacterium]|nr:sugar transferase [Anaerolineales bacterium]
MSASNVSEFPKVVAQNNLAQPVAQWIKRILDVTIAALGLLFLAPLLGLLAVAIRIDSSGPAFYWHPRIGQGGKTFKMLKFRTMRIDA